jgi:Leucine-rich repeat (LRR) protein
MLENSYASVEVARVDGHFERLIPQLRLSPTMTGAMLREFFVGRAGLLREPVMGIIDFAHRSFQEFLAAREALAEDDIGVLITKAHDDQWREVILVAVGLARPREREELLRGLMDRGDREPHNRAYLHLLAVACLETSGRLEPEITKAAIERAQQLVPPQDADTARLIAGAGDAIVPLLAPNIDYSEQEIILCIDTLGQIGTSTAMAAIATYASSEWDNNIPPIGSFGAAWDYFDRLSYAKNVLASFKQLSLNNINSLEGFEFLTELESLYLELTVPVDLTLLTKLSKLKELGVSYAPGTNLEPLTTLVGLNYLGLNSNKLGELSWLSELRTLQSFSVGSIELGFVSYAGTILKTFDLRLLSVFTCLQNLFIHVRDVIDISPIVELSQLTTLQLRASSIENITMLKEPNQLRHLQIISSAGVDLAQLTGCTQLTSLALGMHRMNGHSRSEGGILIKHFKCIRDFSDLKSLALCVESIDLSPVGELAALEELVLWIWESLDLTPLRGLSTLYTLHIWDVSSSSLGEENHLQPSITGIEHLTMLRKLSFEISDSSARFPIHLLVNLINLEELALGIQDMTPEEVITLARLPKLRKLTLFDHSDLDLREFYEKPGFELVLL